MEDRRKICVITGANKGIGYEAALTLGLMGWEVVLACRSFAHGNQAVMALNSIFRQTDPGGKTQGLAVFMELDLASIASVETFVVGFKKRYPVCDALICNAGVMGGPYSQTVDGFERQFGVNYLGHVALFARLFPFLRRSMDARVVQVSSRAHERASLAEGEIQQVAHRSKETYNPWKAYAQSKLLQVLFTQKAQEVYGSDALRFYAVHPGVIATDLLLSPLPALAKTILRPLAQALTWLQVLQTPKKGADSVTYPILASPPLLGGTYWADGSIRDPNPLAQSTPLKDEVWNYTWDLLRSFGIQAPIV
ncbi:MAG: SDR family NAD(P)-dependent oxidoreductase [Spirochaetes bacterium]|nr:SDR family NAD(P)-dependent oxidoreductase [Spirochaetota bacterium]